MGDSLVQYLEHLAEAVGAHPAAGDLDLRAASLDAVIEERAEDLVALLQDVQDRFGYLPRDALELIARRAGISLARIYGVATFYACFSLWPRGRRTVKVCTGTACHVRGAHRVLDALGEHLAVRPGGTTADRTFTLETAACLGCCSLAPAMMIGEETYGRLDARSALHALDEPPPDEGSAGTFPAAAPDSKREPCARKIVVGMGSCGVAAGARYVLRALQDEVSTLGLHARVETTGCLGLCYREVLVELVDPEIGSVLYGSVTPERVPDLLASHYGRGRVSEDLWVRGPGTPAGPAAVLHEPDFLAAQHRIVLRNCGRIDPDRLDDYLGRGGYDALGLALSSLPPEEVIAEISSSGLRGRGGAGFPVGRKWALAREAPGSRKFVICNADEGDPGAFMDRTVLEGDPFSVLEGMALCAYAIGASEGVVYVRAEYPLAVARLDRAVATARARGFLGARLLGADFDFDIRVVRGGGAFVCGEETALIASVEGRRGLPTRRPPYPVEQGLHGRPTVINNVETLANVPWILSHGAEAFSSVGHGRSRGTKVFSLAGDVRRSGMVEVPMGTTLRRIVEDLGGGAPGGRAVKAVQIGGPSGGCVPAHLLDTPVDYESLAETGAIMGSGGMVVMDSSRCMVDIARYFLAFTQRESCGKCTFCRVGTRRMLEVLDRLCTGAGCADDLALLGELATQVGAGSLCGLGKTAPNPVLTTLRHFRSEYEAHAREGRCPAGSCREIVRYAIDPYVCDGCTLCSEQCATRAIAALGSSIALRIDPDRCARCGGCFEVCGFDAVQRR